LRTAGIAGLGCSENVTAVMLSVSVSIMSRMLARGTGSM
jgi:hypothetical protein